MKYYKYKVGSTFFDNEDKAKRVALALNKKVQKTDAYKTALLEKKIRKNKTKAFFSMKRQPGLSDMR